MRFVRFLAVPVVMALGVLAWAPAASAEASSFLGADLSGAKEVPPTDPALSGDAAVSLDTDSGEVCYNVMATVASATGMHIHRGATGVIGPIVVTLDATQLNSPDPSCTASTPSIAAEIKANPSGFYVNVHTTTYPDGAVRGQLDTGILWVPLSPAQEVPPVASTSTGRVFLIFTSATELCADVQTSITMATGMHIHRGVRGTNGPIVVPFNPAQLSGEQCVTVAAGLLAEIAADPAGFYFNIHTAANPGGEIRGQLAFGVQAARPTATAPPAGGGAAVVMPRGVNAGSGGQAADGPGTPSPLLVVAAVGGAAAVLGAGVVTARRRAAAGSSTSR